MVALVNTDRRGFLGGLLALAASPYAKRVLALIPQPVARYVLPIDLLRTLDPKKVFAPVLHESPRFWDEIDRKKNSGPPYFRIVGGVR